MRSSVPLLTAIGIGPLAWFINFEWSIAAVPFACTSGSRISLYIISLAAFVLALLGAAYSLTQLRVPERNAAGKYDPLADRRRALALAGLGISSLCLLLVVAQSIPNLMLGACE